MSEKEKNIVEKLKDAIPKMSDFDKGYILGKVENMAEQKEKKHKEAKEACVSRGCKMLFVSPAIFDVNEWKRNDPRIHKYANCRYRDHRTLQVITQYTERIFLQWI